ncbi:hypothetical protein FOZ62_011137, partial [Perkinsus olseni]
LNHHSTASRYEDEIRGTAPTPRPFDDKSQIPWIGLVTDSTIRCVSPAGMHEYYRDDGVRVYESTKAGALFPEAAHEGDLMNEIVLERLLAWRSAIQWEATMSLSRVLSNSPALRWLVVTSPKLDLLGIVPSPSGMTIAGVHRPEHVPGLIK